MTASTWPSTRLATRAGGVMLTHCTAFASIPLIFAKAGNITRLASPTLEPIRLPLRSCGVLMLFSSSVPKA